MDIKQIRAFTHDYTDKDNRLAALSYFGTFAVYFAALAVGAWAWAGVHWLAALPFIVILGFASVRLYVLQHDCGHVSLFSSRRLNDLAGYALSVFTLTPYAVMRYNHNLHHAHVGNLDHREDGEVYTMTLAEWHRAGWAERLIYRAYRNPAVMLGLGGAYTYFIRYRWPRNTRAVGVAGVLIHNALLVAWAGLVWMVLGVPGLVVLALSALVAGVIGVFLVYLQHNFEDTHWDRRPDLNPQVAALMGSSCLNLGHWWDIGTGNIAYHDIHHFNPRIPSYRLRRCHFALDGIAPMRRIGWAEALASFRLKLWDEEAGRLVPFPAATARKAAAA
ncbi:fatty acid desaturase [Lutimaribacter sp. EGI FJ00015]|uniref:Fatty acid desaturase n=1 Tax=Lutimaribacter degradans TaxID=2945989 RepID=A0ACC5ZSV4_9RHOB|nr:fatty acid desaturase [Lutimaribacter sp. EGI FJ00013]MCM2561225.1 fatty acid desaturase [Lutimaribacter sp. EGI FJ00013]MCO0611826.1 fatty acid desaturase [Lutimaribacter sp. EGI FJ00015]MCO0635053.1 fatty acid desaturase [Lutimaribacter sp. EGI FJ00014]